MPKNSTLQIQNMVRELGEQLGFISVIEERMHDNNAYAPIYDAVWYLDLTKYFDIDALMPIFINAPKFLLKLKKLPVAGFEIEGASTSSKNQLGNFANLYSGHFLYNFVIVNNGAANGENDTYRRGRKLYKYFYEEHGAKDTVFMDFTHFYESVKNLKVLDTKIHKEIYISEKRKICGGDVTSDEMYNSLYPYLKKSGFEIKQNYSPVMPKIKYHEENTSLNDSENKTANFKTGRFFRKEPTNYDWNIARKPSDMYYIPKLDTVLGFNLPSSFYGWLSALSLALNYENVSYPILYGVNKKIIEQIFVPIVGIEFENSINKHCNGGIVNLSHYSYYGILVGNESADSHIRFLKENMGINNVTYLALGELK